MASAWLLPEHISDVLPAQARHIEELRRDLLDVARSYGCELVMPPLLEYLDSLLSGNGQELNLKTFKLVDQLSGRTLGVRADTTPQVARIDAHLLNRSGLTRLCYCGPVLHTKPAGLYSTREPLQFGAEIYGHAGLEADLEVIDLALDCLRSVGVGHVTLDMGDSRIVRALLDNESLDDSQRAAIASALAAKDAATLGELTTELPSAVRTGLRRLLSLYGGEDIIQVARRELPALPGIVAALDDLHALTAHVRLAHPRLELTHDLADLGGFGYYSGTRFAIYVEGSNDAIARGGRYDAVGAVFGRNRPAVGFSLDLKELAEFVPVRRLAAAIRAPWSEDPALRTVVRQLREQGETVVCVLPGHEHEGQEFDCDRELLFLDGQWRISPLQAN